MLRMGSSLAMASAVVRAEQGRWCDLDGKR
jgi:hypothetical protein